MNGCLQFSFAFYGRSIKSVARNPAIEIRGEETPDFALDSPLSPGAVCLAAFRQTRRMFRLLLLSDSFRHPVHFPARIFQLPLRLFLLRTGHLRQRFGKLASGAAQDGDSPYPDRAQLVPPPRA